MKKYFLVFGVILFLTAFFTIKEFQPTITKSKTLAVLEEKKNVTTELRNEYSNDEIVGLLEIPNTDYKTVITQGSDNKKYLNHDEYGNKNRNGSTFLDYRVDLNTSKKILIYGHNSRYIEMPFKILENYYDKDYFKEHQYIKIYTDDEEKTYQIFSVYVETSDWDYMKVDFKTDEEWLNHLFKLKNNSMYDTEVNVSGEDEILILQTCSTKKEYRSLAKKFLLVISRRVN